MRLLFNTRNRRTEERFSMKKIDSSVLVRVMDFAGKIEPLKRPSSLDIKLVDSAVLHDAGCMVGGAPYYVLIFSGEEELEYLNAGYAAGQIASYLRFLGIAARVLRDIAPWMQQQAQGETKCMAAVAFGRAAMSGSSAKKKETPQHPCISREYCDEWAEEVLDFAKKSFPIHLGCVRVLSRGNCICVVPKNISGKRSSSSELEAGLAAANVLAAAEELWIELSAVDTGDARCLISLCRQKDRASVIKKSRNTFTSGQRESALKAVGRLG